MALGQAVERIARIKQDLTLPGTITTTFAGTAQVFQDALANQGLAARRRGRHDLPRARILYESFIHPLTILTGLPAAAIGALGALQLFGMDLSVIAIIGVLMLIGIVKKNAIMMIDVALVLQRERLDPGRGDPRGVPPALPPDHDDDRGGGDGHPADRDRPRRQRRAAPASRRRGWWGGLLVSQLLTCSSPRCSTSTWTASAPARPG